MQTCRDYAVTSDKLWHNVDFWQLLVGSRSDYVFASEETLPSGFGKRVFYNETRNDGTCFAEYFTAQGRFYAVGFFDTNGKMTDFMLVDSKPID